MAATGTEIASAYVSLITKMPGVQGEIQRSLGGSAVKRTLESSGNSMGAILAGAVGGAAAAATSKAISLVTGAIDGAVKRVDTMNSFPKIMKNLGYSADDAQKSIKRISDGLAGLPTTLDGMAGTVQQLAPLTGGLDEATGLALALNNAMLAGGKSTDIQANAMEQYTQMLALGKVDMAAWRSMVTAMPGQMDQLSISILGAGNKSMDLYEALKSGTVTFDQFNAAVMKLNAEGVGAFASFEKQALDSTDGIGTGWANLQTAITRNLANIVQKLKPAIDAFLVGGTAIANALGPVALGVIDVAMAVGGWAAANRDWLVPAAAVVGVLIAYHKSVQLLQAVKVAYAAASYGAAAASYASGVASKIGAAAYAIQNSSLVRLIASLRANEALSLRSKIAIVASTVATNAATLAQRAWNAAAASNPIGVIVTAVLALVGALVYFFTQTETGKAIWAEFTRFLGEAWANISQFFQDTWNNVLKPVFEGIGQVFSFVWNSILKPVFDAIAAVATWVFTNILQPAFRLVQVGFAVLGGIFQGIWEAVLKPVFDAIGAVFKWLWDTIISVIIAYIVIQVKVWGAIFTWLWNTILKPVFNAIGKVFQWIYQNIILPIVAGIQVAIKAAGAVFTWLWQNAVKPAIDGVASVFRWLFENIIKPVWDGISNTIKGVWENGIKPVIDTLSKVIQSDPKAAFEAARDAIGKAWEGIQDLAKKPVKFVIETVINGLIGTVNKILPEGMKIPTVPLPKGFRVGGYTGDVGVNTAAGVVHGREFVTRAESTAKIMRNHPGVLEHMNRYGEIPGYRKGGLVNPLPAGSYSVSQPYHGGHNGIDLAAAQGTRVYAAADGVVDLAGVVPMGGNEVHIQHANGLATRYSHLSRFATGVGTKVKAGHVIGYVGSTGMSTGPHLHYMVHNPGTGPMGYGNHVNPAPYMGLQGKDLGEAGGAQSILDGLVDFAVSKVKGAFPDGGLFIDVAAGLAKNAAETMAKVFNPFAASDGHTLPYDNGGWLQPGRHLVENKSGRPEPILTASQWDALLGSDGGSHGPVRVFIGEREFEGWMDDRADAAVDRGYEDRAAAGRFASYA